MTSGPMSSAPLVAEHGCKCAGYGHLKCMLRRLKHRPPTRLVQEWLLSPAATLGSSVRAEGILLEARARLPYASRKLLDLETGALVLRVPEDDDDDHRDVIDSVTKTVVAIEDLPVIPREVEDVLTIKSSERHRWLKDGRLKSAGTRTVKLRGRARKITFHVFDPRHIEDVLDRDMPALWREQDALTAAENRRRAAGKAALSRAEKRSHKKPSSSGRPKDGGSVRLEGWDEFASNGLLR